MLAVKPRCLVRDAYFILRDLFVFHATTPADPYRYLATQRRCLVSKFDSFKLIIENVARVSSSNSIVLLVSLYSIKVSRL